MTAIPNFDRYQGDPLIWKDASDPGKMRHTFTGLRSTFASIPIHYAIAKHILPLRIGICQQGRGVSEGAIDVNLMTFIHSGLLNVTQYLKDNTFDGQVKLASASLDERQKAQAEFVKQAKDRKFTVENMAAELSASHSDALLQPPGTNDPSLMFDWEGRSPDYPQPTPARFPNSDIRLAVVGLDLITVHLTNMPSASERRHLNAQDNARAQIMFADLYSVVSRAGQQIQPYNPAGVLESQKDGVWNADGSHDVDLNEGDGQRGEQERFKAAQGDPEKQGA